MGKHPRGKNQNKGPTMHARAAWSTSYVGTTKKTAGHVRFCLPPHTKNGQTKPGKKSTYVLLKGQKQSLYLPEKNKNSFHFLLWVEFLVIHRCSLTKRRIVLNQGVTILRFVKTKRLFYNLGYLVN